MQITIEELERRLGSEKNLINQLNIDDKEKTDLLLKKAKESEKVIMGTLASSSDSKEVALGLECDVYDVKEAIKDSPVIKEKVTYSKERLYDLAIEKTCKGLGLITDDKLENADLNNLTRTILATSKVAERILSGEVKGNANSVQIIFNAPRSKRESDYKVIDIN